MYRRLGRRRIWSALCMGLLAFLMLTGSARADVYIMTTGYVLDPLPDIPADFGPEIPDEGIEGLLRIADPEDACSPFTFSDFQTPWIALIARQQQLHANNCTFDVKVTNAQAAGALAAIVYDDVYESLIIMSKPKGHLDPFIPSVFVSQKAGIIMHKLMTLDTIRVRITPLSNVAWLSMLMSAFLGVLALGVVLATFYVMRSWSMWITGMNVRGTGNATGAAGAQAGAGQHGRATGPLLDPGMPADALRSLPVLVFEPSVSSRPSQVPSAAPSGAASLSSLPGSMSQAHARMAAAVGAAVWAEEAGDEAEAEEMRPLLDLPAGDLEEGCGGCAAEGDEEAEAEEMASRSSSDGGAGAVPISGALAPRPPGTHAGETKRVCTICLESYQEGDKIRVLPCAHRFHMGCVDQWLGGRRFCPVCKHDATQPLPLPRPAQAGAGAAGGGRAGPSGTNGWALLWDGFLSIMRNSGAAVSPPRPGAAAGAAAAAGGTPGGVQQPAQRARSRRQQQQLHQLRQSSNRAAAGNAAPELQEPLLAGSTPQPAQAQARQAQTASLPGPAVTAAPAGDVEAPGPSVVGPAAETAAAIAAEVQPPNAVAAGDAIATSPADNPAAVGGNAGGGQGAASGGFASRIRLALAGLLSPRSRLVDETAPREVQTRSAQV